MKQLRQQKLYFDFMSTVEHDPDSVHEADDPMEVLALTAWELQIHLLDTRKLLEKDRSADFPATRRLLANKFFSISDTLVDLFSYTNKLGHRGLLVNVTDALDCEPEDLIDLMEELADRVDYADAVQKDAEAITITTSEGNVERLKLAEIDSNLNAIGSLVHIVHQDMLKLDTQTFVSTFPNQDPWGFHLMEHDPSFNALNRLLKIKYNKAYLAKS